MNLDGYALPIKNLKGTEPVESLDLSHKELRIASAIVIASLIGGNGSLTSLDLSNNQLCGVNEYGNETYNADGITAIADALRVNGSLTKMSLAWNTLGVEGTKAICDALEQNKTLKELDLSGFNMGGAAGAKHVAKMLGVNGSLTSLDLSDNQLCGLNIWGQGTYTSEGITAIADALRVNSALTSLNLSSNNLCSVTETGYITITASEVQGSSFKEGDKVVYQGKEMIVSNAKETNHIRIGPDIMTGLNALADAFRVNGGLTKIE